MNLLKAQRAVFMSDLQHIEKLVALALLGHWSIAGETFPSVERLARWTSLSTRSVIRALASLEAKGAITVRRTHGRANRYVLDALMSLMTSDSQSPVTVGHQCHTVTQPVTLSHQSSDTQSPEEIQEEIQVRDPKKSGRASARRKPSKVEASQTPEQAANHASITRLYFERFEAARGHKPVFDSQDGKAVRDLLAKCGPENAAKAIEGAFGSWWKDKTTIRNIAKEPSKFIGLKPDNGKGRAPVQNSGVDVFAGARSVQ